MRFFKYLAVWLLLIGGLLLIEGLVGGLLGAWRTVSSFFLTLEKAITTVAPLGLIILLAPVLATIIFIGFVAIVEWLSRKTSILATPPSSETQPYENENKNTATPTQDLNITSTPSAVPSAVDDVQQATSQSEITASSAAVSTPRFESPARPSASERGTIPVNDDDLSSSLREDFGETPREASNTTLFSMPITSFLSPTRATLPTNDVSTPLSHTTPNNGESTTPIQHQNDGLNSTPTEDFNSTPTKVSNQTPLAMPIISSPDPTDSPRGATLPANDVSTPLSHTTPNDGESTTPVQHHDDDLNSTPTKVSKQIPLAMPIVFSPDDRDSPTRATRQANNFSTPSSHITPDDSGSNTPIRHHYDSPTATTDNSGSTTPIRHYDSPTTTTDIGGSTTPIRHYDSPTATTDNCGSTTPIQHHDATATTPASPM